MQQHPEQLSLVPASIPALLRGLCTFVRLQPAGRALLGPWAEPLLPTGPLLCLSSPAPVVSIAVPALPPAQSRSSALPLRGGCGSGSAESPSHQHCMEMGSDGSIPLRELGCCHLGVQPLQPLMNL